MPTSCLDERTLDLTRELVSRASITPADAGCLELIASRLAPLGFSIERVDRGDTCNLWARRGSGAPIVCFAGHTDVVPTGPLAEWSSEPFVASERGGQLYGRGTADMKTSLAAFVTAIEDFVDRHPDHGGAIALLLTSDEEGDAIDGTTRVVELLRERGERLQYCIVGEPTSSKRFGDTIKNGRRGSLSGKLKVHGIQGHIAYPQLARNPIHELAPALAELASIEWDQGSEYFPPTSWQVSNIHAGTGANNVIPGAVEVLFNFRFAPVHGVDELKSRVHQVLEGHRLDYRIDWALSGMPFITPRGRLVSALTTAIHAVTKVTPELSTSGGTSDGRFIATICDEVVEFGPINASIHKIDEHVAIDSIGPLARIYLGTLENLLTDGAMT